MQISQQTRFFIHDSLPVEPVVVVLVRLDRVLLRQDFRLKSCQRQAVAGLEAARLGAHLADQILSADRSRIEGQFLADV